MKVRVSGGVAHVVVGVALDGARLGSDDVSGIGSSGRRRRESLAHVLVALVQRDFGQRSEPSGS